jgi:hypothetical protein
MKLLQFVLLLSCLSLTTAVSSFATSQSIYSLGDFAAPLVLDKSQIQNQLPFGSIIYDKATLSFQGLDNTGAWVIFGVSTTAPRSELIVNQGSGHGSTNTTIRRFSNVVKNSGAGITYASSATLGDTFTINEAGVYSISYTDQNSAASTCFGISVNSTQLTTSITGINASNQVMGTCASSGTESNVSATLALNAGDIIRAHTNGSPDMTAADNKFRITKVNP